MRKLQIYIDKYGPETGPKLYHTLQSQAAHAGVSARLRRKIRELTGESPRLRSPEPDSLPLFPDLELIESATTQTVDPQDRPRESLRY